MNKLVTTLPPVFRSEKVLVNSSQITERIKAPVAVYLVISSSETTAGFSKGSDSQH